MERDSRAPQTRAAALRGAARAQKRALDAELHTEHGRKLPPYDGAARHAWGALRATYVSLLLTCTFDQQGPGAESLLWTETTYAVISAFRSALSAIEGDDGRAEKRRIQAYQRVLRSLRRFLAEEEAYWAQLAARVVRMYALGEAHGVLAGVGIAAGADGATRLDAPDLSFDRDATVQPQAEREALAADAAHRAHLVALVARMLTYCGDIVRYREQYAAPALLQSRGAGTKEVPCTTPNFAAAARLYHAAGALCPASGGPENQLAVLALYRGDRFGALFHYMNAYVAAQPFENARFNFRRIVAQALPRWRRSDVRAAILGEWKHAALASAAGAPTCVPMRRLSIGGAEWLALLVELHALLACSTELDCAAALDNALRDTVLVLADDALRAVDFVRAMVVGIRADVLARRGDTLGDAARPVLAVGEVSPARAARAPELARLLRVCTVTGLVTALSAVCRHALATRAAHALRTLPALRLALKWVRHDLAHIAACARQAAQLDVGPAADVSAASDPDARFDAIMHDVPGRFAAFWSAYAALVHALAHAYPRVPHVPAAMPEDRLLAAVGIPLGAVGADSDEARIGDLLADADAVRADARAPLGSGDDDDPVDTAMRAFESQREEQAMQLHPHELLGEMMHPSPAGVGAGAGAAVGAGTPSLPPSLPPQSLPPSLPPPPVPPLPPPGAAAHMPAMPPPAPAAWPPWHAWPSQPSLLFGTGAHSSIWSTTPGTWRPG